MALNDLSQQDISLPSFTTTPGRPGQTGLRIPSTSSRTTATSSAPLSTPSPPFTRRNTITATNGGAKSNDEAMVSSLSSRFNLLNQRDDIMIDTEEGDILDTPAAEKGSRKWGGGMPESSSATSLKPAASTAGTSTNSKKTGGNATTGKGGVTLTLRDQEKHIDSLKKENFNIKLRVHFLEERLAQLAPDQIETALKQNISLKIELHNRGQDLKKLKKLVISLERELERLQRGGATGSGSNRERELEEKLEEREREVAELRRRSRGGSRYSSSEAEEEAEHLLHDAETRNAQLEEELENARALLEENMDEIDRLREMVESQQQQQDNSLDDSAAGSRRDRLKRRIEELESENDQLRADLDDHENHFAQWSEEKEGLVDEVDYLRLTVEDLQRRREAESIERSESRAQVLSEREEREAVEDDLNSVRDKLAAVMIELQTKEDEVELKNREIEELVTEHQRIVEVVEGEWRDEVEEAKGQVEKIRDELAERDAECKDLRVTNSELEAMRDDLHVKFEDALSELEREAEQKDAEIEVMQQQINKLGDQLYQMEDENDRLREEMELVKEEEGAERERLEALGVALKEKIAELKDQLQETSDAYETCRDEIHAHRSRQEELATHIESLVDSLEQERASRERLESDLDNSEKEHDSAVRNHKRALETKESALQNTLNELARTQSLLTQREGDLEAVQSGLRNLEAESKKLGETHTTTRFSLQLETDRLKRDLERVEEELARSRREVEERDNKSRDREAVLDRLYSENREMATQIASQNQARLNISEKLDTTLSNLKVAEGEVTSLRLKVAELESRLSKDQRSLLTAEGQYRDQLTERNTLLLTIYQYLDKILGVDKTPKKSGQAETKPFTNFSVFHDNLITRLKALSQIQLDFDKRCKETEAKFTEKLADMRKQLDHRWKQIDKFEAAVRSYADTKAGWKRKLALKDGEAEALKATNTELTAQINAFKRAPGTADAMEVRSLSVRAANAERRFINAQNQLASTEEKIATMNQKNLAADSKWEARVKEYEARLKAAEERVKRERQGSKERVAELENNLKGLQRQLEVAQKRNAQLADVVENATTKPAGSSSPANNR